MSSIKRPVAVGAWAALALVLAMPANGLASNPAAGLLRVAVDSNADFSPRTITAHNESYVVLQPWQTTQRARIKDAHPNTKVLIHENLSGATTTSNNGLYSSGVSYQEANRAHPSWFLKDSSGRRITFKGYGSLYALDVGNPDYQKAWANNVIKTLKNKGFDGVFMDNTDTAMSNDFANYPAKYPTDAQWQAATKSALAYVGPRIKAAAKLAIPNIGAWGGNPAVGRSWLQYVSGGVDEMFLKWGNTPGSGYASPARWASQLASLEYAQQQGKIFLAVTHSSASDRAAARYGWATMLLGGGGRAAYTMTADYTHQTWFPEYDYAIGNPRGPESAGPNGVHRRLFSNGIVLVNPTTAPLSANLGGVYSGSGLTGVRSVTLAPHSGYVLIKVSGSKGGGSSSNGALATTTWVAHTPRRHGGIVRGRVATRLSASSSSSGAAKRASRGARGNVKLRLYRRDAKGWRPIRRPRIAHVGHSGRFRKRLSTFRHPLLNPGVFRVRALYLGSHGARPSTSRARTFRLRA
jgi:Hypothetical glycosyl hydrolase family 15